jgi:hypothetical protein
MIFLELEPHNIHLPDFSDFLFLLGGGGGGIV